jgi:hypothetical protein
MLKEGIEVMPVSNESLCHSEWVLTKAMMIRGFSDSSLTMRAQMVKFLCIVGDRWVLLDTKMTVSW